MGRDPINLLLTWTWSRQGTQGFCGGLLSKEPPPPLSGLPLDVVQAGCGVGGWAGLLPGEKWLHAGLAGQPQEREARVPFSGCV